MVLTWHVMQRTMMCVVDGRDGLLAQLTRESLCHQLKKVTL